MESALTNLSSLPFFIITIDTEGDNLWSKPSSITTNNSKFLPRFQELCQRYGHRPTYLVNYEMAKCPVFIEFGRSFLKQNTGEVGMHLHAWNSPPLYPLTSDDSFYHPYLIEYPEAVLRDKIAYITNLLQDTFGTRMRSHRAGRWAFNSLYARELLEFGYEIDCSVTPNVSWSNITGDPIRHGGVDYRDYPELPYYIYENIQGLIKTLIEAPMTIISTPNRKNCLNRLASNPLTPTLLKRISKRISPDVIWLRPNGRNQKNMLWVIDQVLLQKRPYAQFMLHSSELMPGCSPTFKDCKAIDRLYEGIEELFEYTKGKFLPGTLGEYASSLSLVNS